MTSSTAVALLSTSTSTFLSSSLSSSSAFTVTSSVLVPALLCRGGGDNGSVVRPRRRWRWPWQPVVVVAPPPPPQSPWVRAFFAIPEPARYFLSGNCGNLVFYGMERFLALLLISTSSTSPQWMTSVTFFAAYLWHVPAQHYLHALLVYGLDSINTRQKYWNTLVGMSSTLVVAAVGSTALHAALLQTGKLSPPVAFFTTMYLFAIINYLVISWIVKKSNDQAAAAAGTKKIRNKRASKK